MVVDTRQVTQERSKSGGTVETLPQIYRPLGLRSISGSTRPYLSRQVHDQSGGLHIYCGSWAPLIRLGAFPVRVSTLRPLRRPRSTPRRNYTILDISAVTWGSDYYHGI